MSDNHDPQDNANPTPPADISAQVDAAVAEKLKDIKARLDSVYGERDTLKKQAQELTDKLATIERDRLIAEGKQVEALQLQLTDLQTKNAELQTQLVSATRDSQLQSMLAGLPFRTDKARQQALREITADLRQTSDGSWVTKDGVEVSTFVKNYAGDPENTYLFKPQTSSGGGSTSTSAAPATGDKKSLFAMSQAEVLRLAREGKLRK
jgi:hypothetical protein